MKEELPFANMSPRMDDERILIEQPGVNVMIRGTSGEVDDSPPVVQVSQYLVVSYDRSGSDKQGSRFKVTFSLS